MKIVSFIRRLGSQPPEDIPGHQRNQSGDTLVEILVAIVIIGLTVVALLGVLTTSVTSTAEYRSLATIDTVMKTFSDAIKADIQFQTPTGTSYLNCAMSYTVASEYPSSAVPGGDVTTFGTGFTSGRAVSIALVNSAGVSTAVPSGNFLSGQTVVSPNSGMVPAFTDGVVNGATTLTSTTANFSAAEDNGQPIQGVDIPAGTTMSVTSVSSVTLSNPATGSGTIAFSLPARYGTIASTFEVPPTMPSGTYSVVLSDGTNSATAPTDLTVSNPPPAPATSAVAGFKVAISSIQWWNGATQLYESPFGTSPASCGTNDDSGIQMITISASAPNNVNGTLQVVVTDPAYAALPGPAVTVSAPTTSVGQSLTFTATVQGSGSAPTGKIGWAFGASSPGSPSCATPVTLTANGSSATAICMVSPALAGTYQITANYSGDGNYGFASGFGTAVVAMQTPTVTVSAPPTTVGQSLVFTASVSGAAAVTPSGKIAWTITSSPTSPAPTCQAGTPSVLIPGGGGTATATCTLSSAQLTPPPYSVTASYSGDLNYTSAVGSGSDSVQQPLLIDNVQLLNGGMPGKIDQGDSISVTFSAPLRVSTICSTWSNSAQNQSDSAGVVTVTSHTNADDKLTISSSDCTFNFGTIDMGSSVFVPSGHLTFKNSTISWNANTDILKITLSNANSGTGTAQVAGPSLPVYTGSSNVTDTFGDPVSNSPYTLDNGSPQPQF